MAKKTNQSCPQCFHINSQEVLKCSLCGWLLKQEQLDRTRISELTKSDSDSNITITVDHDLTINPKPNSAQMHSAREARTFNLAGNLAHFEIYKIIGKGGMGAVYHAKDRILQRDVALKMLRPLAASNQHNTEVLLDEARMASKLNHPNIITIYDVARTKNSNYIVMEWLEGQSLDELISNEGLMLEKALEYAYQIADGLTSAHQKYITHRDIKPQNIMLTSQDTIKILDFGIAGFINHQSNEDELTIESKQKNASIGTPSYMSPEQVQGLNIDQRTDIFSFGIVLYQMLCGKRPFLGNNLTAVKQAICSGDYTPIQQHLPSLPVNIINLVDKMLVTQREERWQSSAELAKELRTIYNELTYKKNWWQRQGWLSKAALILPFIIIIGWSSKEVLFPASTQQLIERQLQEATKIAILPFHNISGDPELQLFGDGLAVNLSSDLAAIASHQGNTWIVPSTEISRMKDQSLKTVADKYGVNLILTGSIQHMGSTRLLVLNLINAEDGQQLKTAEASINAEQLFKGHALIRSQVLSLLGWSVPNSIVAKFQADRPLMDGAYKQYIQGKAYLYRHDQQNNIQNALDSFSRSINLDPRYQLAYVGKAEAQLRQFIATNNLNWLILMEQTIIKLNVINHQHSMLDYLSGRMFLLKGKYLLAVESFEKSIKSNPVHIDSYFGLGRTFEKLNKFKKTDAIYNEVKRISPNNILGIIDLGIIYLNRGDYKKAIKEFEDVIQIAPNNHWAYLNIAAVYHSMSEIDKAIEFTETALQINSTDDAYSNLGTMYFYRGNYDKAVNAYEKMIKLNSKDYINWGNLADAYLYSNNNKSTVAYQQATKLAQQALQLNPKDTTAISHNAYYLANLKMRPKAIKYAQQIGEQQTGQENFITAATYALLNETDLAFEHINYAIINKHPLDEIKTTPLLNNIKKDMRFSLISKK